MRRSAILLALVATLAAGSARAQTVPGKSAAKELFEEGVALEKKGDWTGAAARFDEAAKILATPGVRYHQGYAYEMQGKIATALDHYESAIALAREQKKPDVEKATATRMEPLRAKVPQLAIKLVTHVDAKVRLDDKEVAAPLLDGKSFRVDPGEHTVTAVATGYRDFTKKVTSRESTTSTVDVVLEKGAAAAPPAVPPPVANPSTPTPPAGATPPSATPATTSPTPSGDGPVAEPPKEERRGRSYLAPTVVTAAAIAVAGTGVVAFVLAGGAQDDAKDSCLTKVSCDDERSKVRTLDTIALVGFLGGAALGAAAVVLWVSPGKSQTGAAPRTRIVAGPGGLRLEGAFP